jgi:ribosomal protein S14
MAIAFRPPAVIRRWWNRSARPRAVLAMLAMSRLSTEGPLSSAGHVGGRRVKCPTCGKPVRLKRDEFGYCRNCRKRFDGHDCKSVGN